jgi:predicted nuclease of predicted toxin-antitoxin system
MRRILLDENVPVAVRDQLPGFSVATVAEMGWAGLSNGELLAAAGQAGFDMIVTGDQNIPRQNDLSGSRLAVVVLGTTHWPTVRANPQLICAAIDRAAPGTYTVAAYPRPRLRRRLPRNEPP